MISENLPVAPKPTETDNEVFAVDLRNRKVVVPEFNVFADTFSVRLCNFPGNLVFRAVFASVASAAKSASPK